MKATFDGTVAILVKAYLNDELQFGRCRACAVGNIVKGSGYIGDPSNWMYIRDSYSSEIQRDVVEEAFRAIAITGYTKDEILSIELYFEAWGFNIPSCDRLDMFKGLMRVVDRLAEIHGISLESKESAKALFVKA